MRQRPGKGIIVGCAALLLAGCATQKPQPPPPSPLDDADQRASAQQWLDYVCNLPPNDRQAAVAKANGAYVLIVPGKDADANAHGIALSCPNW